MQDFRFYFASFFLHLHGIHHDIKRNEFTVLLFKKNQQKILPGKCQNLIVFLFLNVLADYSLYKTIL